MDWQESICVFLIPQVIIPTELPTGKVRKSTIPKLFGKNENSAVFKHSLDTTTYFVKLNWKEKPKLFKKNRIILFEASWRFRTLFVFG
jgi:hypothetical protein